jgi:ribosomal protein S18 acetylase RimI-like enzyme
MDHGVQEIRSVAGSDVEKLLELWQRCGVGYEPEQDRREIERTIGHDAELFLVLVDQSGAVVASVMGTYDGHRGRIKRCVVEPTAQRSGAGRRLVSELERRFHQRGITELRLEVWSDNVGAQAFWETLGWNHEPDIRYYTRSLKPGDDSQAAGAS